MRVEALVFGRQFEHYLNTACFTCLLRLLLMFQVYSPMHKVCGNENSEVLKLLFEAKLVDQDMLKAKDDFSVSVHETC